MKNMSGFLILTGSVLVVVFLYIWHHNAIIQHTYRRQRDEKKLEELIKEKERCRNRLLAAQNPHDIKKRATTLGMRPTSLKQMKRHARATKDTNDATC